MDKFRQTIQHLIRLPFAPNFMNALIGHLYAFLFQNSHIQQLNTLIEYRGGKRQQRMDFDPLFCS